MKCTTSMAFDQPAATTAAAVLLSGDARGAHGRRNAYNRRRQGLDRAPAKPQ
jgi:hypothetical protein